MYVIGTAGHVDHGKSALVQALTGIDPDRLQEEKARGMTIDLGFARLVVPAGPEGAPPLDVSIVDVPGHERFIRNMLAGVGGIDLALLVVAADEGVMPQTREHLAILDLLGVERGVVALTKCDLVERDWAELVAAEIEETLAGTTLAGSPVVTCSAVTREGLDELVARLRSQLALATPRPDVGRPRLPIDRAFTVAGFGTVVTGTLVDGCFEVGDEVEVVPAVVGGHQTALRARVRGLQNHNRAVERAQPGTRTAVNLAGVEVNDLYRGQVVVRPGWLQPSVAVDVRLRALASLGRALRHNLNLTFHSGASETPARLRLLEGDRLEPGEEGWAQVRLARPVALVRGDRFVVRDANDTIGGGVVVATQARRHPRRRASVIEELGRRAAGSPEEGLAAAIEARQPVERQALLEAFEGGRDAAQAALESLLAAGRVLQLAAAEGPAFVLTRERFQALARAAVREVEAFQKEHPLRRGMPREELRSRFGLAPRPFHALVRGMADAGFVVEREALVSTPGWQPAPSAAQEKEAAAYLEALAASPYSPPLDRRPSDELVAYLADAGRVVDVGGGVVFTAEAYREMVDGVLARLRQKGEITLAEVRDMFGTSRRYCQALLEHLDQRRVTARRGDARVLGRDAPRAALS
jgi:selenocysteine-specific elongation factor